MCTVNPCHSTVRSNHAKENDIDPWDDCIYDSLRLTRGDGSMLFCMHLKAHSSGGERYLEVQVSMITCARKISLTLGPEYISLVILVIESSN